ncbi:metal ABC transporter solute-binding protein, Zn/Mn family [Paracoccus litorisediminis]|jgi:ABC-type Zn uptake system ZnuABC Zn-binding protein ZnuA|uniref:Uncharacterized protein n=1 Tax=Paracoccus litorisediminis TaxID=2006130 RepID=A0A844HTD1_9RHOB|nr:zinc ABC transporter substrate-binding protein [Paracoccus litorisediminis]MTH61577.1 hypothetical protein [Paracoccus litorisediminis]
MGEETAPWLSPTRLGKVAEIVAGYLSRLAPSKAALIVANPSALKHDLLVLKAEADKTLVQRDSIGIEALSSQFGYFAADLGLDLRASIIAAPREWSHERASRLVDWLHAEGIETVLTARDLPEPLTGVLNAADIAIMHLAPCPRITRLA